MTPQAVRKARSDLGLSLEEFARFVGATTSRAARHWEDGTRPFKGSPEIILRLAIKHPELVPDIQTLTAHQKRK